MAAIEDYVSAFRRLRRDMHDRWPASTLNGAPHKPLLLLAVMDSVDAGNFRTGTVALTAALQQRFHAYWRALRLGVGLDQPATPFHHLATEPFWHEQPHNRGETPTATLDAQFVALLRRPETTQQMRAVLIDEYFDGDARDRLWHAVNHISTVAPSSAERERHRRQDMWHAVVDEGRDADGVSPKVLRDEGIYGGYGGIWIDRAKTRPLTADGNGVTVALLHTGQRHDRDLTSEGVIYHYPRTRRLGRHDEMEIEATKNAARLGLPVFVISHTHGGLRRARVAQVDGWNDAAEHFWVPFADQPERLPSPNVVDDQPFVLKQSRTAIPSEVIRRTQQGRFEFMVFERYGPRCAVCDLDIKDLLDAAHIVPWAEGGSDDPRNGLVLCANHHRAYDASLFCLEPGTLRVVVRPEGPDRYHLGVTRDGLTHLRRRPHDEALAWRYKGWQSVYQAPRPAARHSTPRQAAP